VIIAIGCDHRGFQLKRYLCEELQDLGHEVRDCGCQGTAAADYPVAAFAVGELVAGGQADRGILICGSGIGVAIAANKVAGVRAALCHDPRAAQQTRRHNDSNVICFSGDATSPGDALAMLEAFFAAEFEGGRHARRVDLIRAYESSSRHGEA
jgi:ribose 5-phosphate isomerase B